MTVGRLTLIFPLGALVRLAGSFSDPNDETIAIDPTTVAVRVKTPGGVETAYSYPASVVRDAAGAYHFDVDANAAGTWCYRWESTGTGQAAAEAQFKVGASAFS